MALPPMRWTCWWRPTGRATSASCTTYWSSASPCAPTATIPATLVARALRDKPAEIQPLAEARAAFERDYLITLLKLTRGQVSEVARLAGRNRTECTGCCSATTSPRPVQGSRTQPTECRAPATAAPGALRRTRGRAAGTLIQKTIFTWHALCNDRGYRPWARSSTRRGEDHVWMGHHVPDRRHRCRDFRVCRRRRHRRWVAKGLFVVGLWCFLSCWPPGRQPPPVFRSAHDVCRGLGPLF